MRIGCHVSISPKVYLAVDRAKSLGCDTFQIFASNPRAWKSPPLGQADLFEFKVRQAASSLSPLVVHVPYLVNLASPDAEVHAKSMVLFEDSLIRAGQLGADFLVLHPGSHLGQGTEAGIERVVASLEAFIPKIEGDTKILLENTAGQGGSLGAELSELSKMIEGLEGNPSFGVCFDTAHGFAAGYDVRAEEGIERTIEEIESSFGLSRLFLIHINDSKAPLGSRVDRHDDIGKGHIGLDGFKILLNHSAIRELDAILETPKKDEEDDRRNLATIRALLA
ncbi:MAG: deoxyribonuclease IV [Actinomycetota bacterium]|nr:deoxyribonuclease IV [Actinomycetota bacterium]